MIASAGKLPGPATMNPSILSSFNEINILFLLMEQKGKVFKIRLFFKKNISDFCYTEKTNCNKIFIFAIKEYDR